MRKVVIVLTAIVFMLVMGIAAFKAQAAIGAGTQALLVSPERYSQIEEAACDGQGMFCRKGAVLRCNPICICEPCSKQMRTQKPKR
jgi:hypothetical protein